MKSISDREITKTVKRNGKDVTRTACRHNTTVFISAECRPSAPGSIPSYDFIMIFISGRHIARNS